MVTSGIVELPEAARCIVVVVDMQNDYCHPDGAIAKMGSDVSAAAAVAPAVRSLVALAHGAAVPVVFVRTTHGPWTDTPGWRGRGEGGDLFELDRVPLVAPGSWGAELFELEPGPDDLVLTKHRYSGFAYTPLELAFRARQRDVGLYAGTMTNACVEATALDGLMRGIGAVLVADASATSTPEVQRGAEEKFAQLVGPVTTVDQIRAAWAVA